MTLGFWYVYQLVFQHQGVVSKMVQISNETAGDDHANYFLARFQVMEPLFEASETLRYLRRHRLVCVEESPAYRPVGSGHRTQLIFVPEKQSDSDAN
jgi:hypothetical protein